LTHKPKGGIVKNYEQMFVLNPALDEEAEKALAEKLATIVTNDGGEVLDLKKWGKRRLAYEIKGQTEGSYWVLTFKAPPQVPLELRRIVKITEGFLRDILVDLTDSIKAQKNREVHMKAAEARRAAKALARDREREQKQETEQQVEEPPKEA